MNRQNQIGENAKDLDPDMKVYLLVGHSSDLGKTVGFKTLGSGEIFTFAFSSPEKLQAFVGHQQQKGSLGSLGNKLLTYWMTLEEYFSKPERHLLYIDPPHDFPIDYDLPFLN